MQKKKKFILKKKCHLDGDRFRPVLKYDYNGCGRPVLLLPIQF